MYRPNRFTPLMPAAVQPKRSLTNKDTAIRSSATATNPPVEDDQAFQTADQRLAQLRASAAVYTTQSEAYLVVKHQEGQDVVFIKPDARSETLPLTWSAVNGSELDHKPVTTATMRTYMKARGYPADEVEADAMVHKLAGEKRIRFRRHGRNPNVWFATSLRPSATQQQKPRARPWYGIR